MGPKYQLILTIGFAVAGAVLFVFGLLLSIYGLSAGRNLIIIGIIALITALVLGIIWGFIGNDISGM